jgi:hypothetical protein
MSSSNDGRIVLRRSGKAWWLLALLAVITVIACGGGPDGKAPGATPPPAAGSTPPQQHAIHVFAVQKDGTKKRLDFGQGTEIASATAANAPPGSGGTLRGQSVKDPGGVHVLNDPTSPLQPVPTIGAPGTDIASTAWPLLQRAALQCDTEGLLTSHLPPWDIYLDLASLRTEVDWFIYSGLIDSGDVLQSCAGRLYVEQNILCVADKLAEIGDAVGTIVWPAVNPNGASFTVGSGDAPNVNDILGSSAGEWDIPPQSDQDRFIVRDLAIHALGMLATLDAIPVTPIPANPHNVPSTCQQLYAGVAGGTVPLYGLNTSLEIPVLDNGNSNIIFGGALLTCDSGACESPLPAFPPSTVPLLSWDTNAFKLLGDNTKPIARSSLQVQAEILRSGGRLLHDLIRRDVYSDLAAAEKQAATALDPSGNGNLIKWGGDPTTGPYGTLAHAARVLAGRWEIGDSSSAFNGHGDPACESVTALNLLQGAYGNDLTAREQDRPIGTKGEALAASLVAQAGIAMPSCAIEPLSGTVLREALVDQLVLQIQLQNMLPNPPSRDLIEAVAQRASDAEIKFGFEYVLRTFRLLTDSADEPVPPGMGATSSAASCSAFVLDPGGMTAGLLPATSALPGVPPVAPSIAGMQGAVVQGGLDRSRLTTDTIARAGGILEASQCRGPEDDPPGVARLKTGIWSFPTAASTDPATLANSGQSMPLPTAVFQDAFSIGQTLERQLVQLNTASAPLTATAVAGDPDPEAVSRGAIAELRSWAGSVFVTTSPNMEEAQDANGNWDVLVPGINVAISGMDLSDLGLSGPTDPNATSTIQNSFGLVYGPPWVAECAAGIRHGCPSNAALGLKSPLAGTIGVSAAGSAPGVLGPTITFQADFTAGNATPPTTPQTQHTYLVLLRAQKNPLGQGQVLGVVAPAYSWAIFGGIMPPASLVVAPMQRELLHNALDLGAWVGAAPPRLGEPSAGDTAGYCVDGVPRDVFVPLQNELTSDVSQSFENSWQHYLSIAQTAATAADSLAQQLLTDDTQLAQTEQAANEQLAEQCGDFGAVSETTIDSSGHVAASSDDPTLQACLNEQTVDVVFLGKDPIRPACSPAPHALTGDPTEYLKLRVLQCNGAGASDPLCRKPVLTCAALGLSVPPAPNPPDCVSRVATLASTLHTTGFDAQTFSGLLSSTTLGTDNVSQTVAGLNFVEDPFGNWQVTYLGEPLMASDPTNNPTLWPGCLLVSKCDPTSEAINTFNAIYRSCAGALGSCEGASTGAGKGTVDAQQAELNIIKWRVMGSITLLAAAAGAMPEGLFDIPIPLVINPGGIFQNNGIFDGDFRAAPALHIGKLQSAPTSITLPEAQSGSFTRPSITLSSWTVSGVPPGSAPGASGIQENIFGQGTTPLNAQSTGSTSGDVLALGTVYSIPSPFTVWPQNSTAGEVPAYYWSSGSLNANLLGQNFLVNSWYGPGSIGTMRHKPVKNSAVSFPHCMALQRANGTLPAECTPPAAGAAPVAPPSNPLSMALMFANAAGALTGVTCTAPSAAVQNLNGGSDLGFADIVSAAKTERYFAPSNCIGPCLPCFAVGSHDSGVSFPNDGACVSPDLPSWPYFWLFLNDGFETIAGRGTNVWTFDGSDALLGSPNLLGWAIFQKPMDNAPEDSVVAFTNSGVTKGTCDALSQLIAAAGLTCAAQQRSIPSALSGAPPPVSSFADAAALEAWIRVYGTNVANAFAGLYTENVPQRVIGDIQSGAVGTGDKSGQYGTSVLQTEQAITSIPPQWAQITTNLTGIADAIKAAQLAITQSAITLDSEEGQLALQQLQLQAQYSEAQDSLAGAVLGADIGVFSSYGLSLATIAAAAQTESDATTSIQNESEQVSANEAIPNLQQSNEVAQALNTLNQTTSILWQGIQTAEASIRTSVGATLTAAQSAQLASQKAQYYAAVGTGSSFVTLNTGAEVSLPLNNVLNRQLSATEIRYQTALTNAKALAYMARRSIEQRLGVPLSALTVPVGPLDPPSVWADDLCSLTGINLQNINCVNTQTTACDGGTDQQTNTQFADAFIGDYVQKLTDFVNYFNVQYPSHQGDDTAILSLRYDLLPPVPQCRQPGANLLADSGNLAALAPGHPAAWQLAPCSPGANKCLAVLPGDLLAPPQDGPFGATSAPAAATDGLSVSALLGATGVTWLAEAVQSPVSSSEDGGADDGGGLEAGAGTAPSLIPSGVVFQPVQLSPGTYMLSWWDQARDPSTGALLPMTATPPPYLVAVLGPSGSEVASLTPTPTVQVPSTATDAGVSPSTWSQRQVLTFVVGHGGTYQVVFGASTGASAALGSVAIADVQLEMTQASTSPSTYVQTDDSKLVTQYGCPPSDSALRSAFQHNCDASGNCFYDLVVPLLVNTEGLAGSGLPIATKLAPGNYNYRHLNLAVNLVGTGVVDCTQTPTPDCFATGYVQYDLQHDGTNAGITDYNGNTRVFDFGLASIRHGKALAAERYITAPIGSADQSLLSQPGIQHIEFQGRPLDGVYRLRIWDSPALKFSQLQDIQIVLNYEYWSEIVASSVGNGTGQ